MTQVSLNEMYDEMLRGEFSPRGKHAAAESGPALPEGARAQGVHIATADAPLHNEFEIVAPPAPVEKAPAEGEGPRGLARYRNAAMVGAGGLACAAVGAFLGGLGGYFTIAPAAAHPLASSTTPDQSSAGAANAAAGAATASGTEAVLTAVLTSLSGSLTQNAAPLQWLTAHGGSVAPVTATLADLASGGSTGTGSDAGGSGAGAGTGDGQSCTVDAGLGCVVGSLTTALGDVGTLPSDPTEELSSLVPSLNGVITDVTGTLANLGSLMPISSLPLPAGGIPSLGLPAIPAISGVPGLAGIVQLVGLDSLSGLGAIPGLDGLGTAAGGVPGSSSAVTSLLSGTGGIAGLLDGVTAAASSVTGAAGSTGSGGSGGSTGSGGSSLGGVISSIPGVSSLPVSASAGGKTSTPAGSASGGAKAGSTSTTTTSTSTTTSTTSTTTVTVPLPSLPLPVSTPPVSVGGVSVGVNTSGSGSGLTLSLP